jgi:PAP2 superfamily
MEVRTTKQIVRLACVLVSLCLGSVFATADVVLDWNEIAVNTAIANGQNPFAQSRTQAIVQLAVFEAVNSITSEYRPYLGTITAPAGASPDAAAVEAAYAVLLHYFSASGPTLLMQRNASLAQVPDGQAKTDAITVGDAAAAAMIALRANDGAAPPRFKTPGSAVPGEWQATPSCPAVNGVASGIAFQWQDVTPFGIAKASDFLLPPPPALTSNAYAKAYNEVMTVGSQNSLDRPVDRSNVASYYAVSSPSQVFNQVARQLALERSHSITGIARVLALMNMAINDALVASFYNKYYYNFWRPETAIHNGDSDGNAKTGADLGFKPFIITPCFPSYPSNHGSGTTAAAEVLRRIWGEGGHSITLSNPAVPSIVFHYTALKQITDDVSDARVYGGIHFRTDQVAGGILGRAIGKSVFKHNLRPVGDDDDD